MKKTTNQTYVRKAIIIICIVLIIIGSGLMYFYWTSVDVISFDMYLNVSDYAGFKVDNDAIWFGTVPSTTGGTVTRSINLKNSDGFTRRVEISASGPLAKWIGVDKNWFIINSGEEKSVVVYAIVPEGTPKGDYTGKLNIVFRKVIFNLI